MADARQQQSIFHSFQRKTAPLYEVDLEESEMEVAVTPPARVPPGRARAKEEEDGDFEDAHSQAEEEEEEVGRVWFPPTVRPWTEEDLRASGPAASQQSSPAASQSSGPAASQSWAVGTSKNHPDYPLQHEIDGAKLPGRFMFLAQAASLSVPDAFAPKREMLRDLQGRRWLRLWLKTKPPTGDRLRGYHATPLHFYHATSEKGFCDIMRMTPHPRLLPGPSTLPGRYVHGLGVMAGWEPEWCEDHNFRHTQQLLTHFPKSNKFAAGILMEVVTHGEHEKANCETEAEKCVPGKIVSTPNCHKPPAVKWALHEDDAYVSGVVLCLDWDGWQ